MKSFIVFALFVAAAVAAPVSPDADAQIVEQHNTNIGVDGYEAGYQTSNGISAQEQAQLKNVGTEDEALVASGQFSYPGPDGVIYSVKWIADELGFRAEGAHLPQVAQ